MAEMWEKFTEISADSRRLAARRFNEANGVYRELTKALNDFREDD